MMKLKRRCLFAAAILGCMLLSACGDSLLPDSYVEGSDYQYMQLGGYSFVPSVQQVENGCYLIYNSYLYYLDAETDTILPLCSKADCLHDKETDPGKYSYCNAYVPDYSADGTGIAYCDGSLYYITGSAFMDEGPALYRVSADGSQKELLYRWSETSFINEWLVHRNVLYYTEQQYLTKEEDGIEKVIEQHTMNALSLTGTLQKPSVIYTADESLDVMTLGKPTAYGNYFYFQIVAYEASDEEITDDNYLDYLYLKTFVYHIPDEELHILTLPDLSPSEVIQGVTFWQDKILFSPSDLAAEATSTKTIYLADLDGSNPEAYMENWPKLYSYFSDGKYLYGTNADAVAHGYEEGDIWYQAYNNARELTDTFSLPFQTYSYPSPGNAEYMYLIYTSASNETQWGVIRWDKSGIGSYDGQAVEIEKIKK